MNKQLKSQSMTVVFKDQGLGVLVSFYRRAGSLITQEMSIGKAYEVYRMCKKLGLR